MGRLKLVLRNFIVNILKWIIIFIIASIFKVNTAELIVLLIVAGVDIFLLLILRNTILKNIVNMSAYWILGPIAQINIINNNDILNILKIVLYFTIIISFQILEYYTYKNLNLEMIE